MNAPAPWFSVEMIDVMAHCHSDAMHIKPLLLVIKGREYPVIGWYFDGAMKEWRMEHSPSKVTPKYWMPMPKLPK